MLARTLVIASLLASASCKQESGADPSEVEVSAPAKGSAGGFSANLQAEMGTAQAKAEGGNGLGRTNGGGSASGSASGSGSGSGSASGSGSGSGSGSASGSGSGSGSASGSGSGSGSGSASGSGSGSASAMAAGSGAKAGSAAATPASAGSGSPPPTTTAGAGSGSAVKAGSAATTTTAAVVTPPPTKPKPVMTPELQAIRLSLEPNWDRDQVEAGSISLFEKNQNVTFKFNYGYEEAKAPSDREAYKKYLADSGILTVKTDRQSGAAWYIEGTDGTGKAAFRVVVTFGGKRLVCGGSLYKDSGLGDLRDSVLLQAKKICETIQL